jgi:hypothetical protein
MRRLWLKRGHLNQVYLLNHLSGYLSEFYKSPVCARLKQPKETIVSHIRLHTAFVVVFVINLHAFAGLQRMD